MLHTRSNMKLSNIKNSKNIFTLLDFSRVESLARTIDLDIDNLEHADHLNFITSKIMTFLSPEVSGVVVDPDFDFNNIVKKANGTGLLLSLEKKTTDVDPTALPKMTNNWGIEHISNNYALAKLELYYHPHEVEAMRKKQFVAEVYDYCKYEGIDLLLELMVYHPALEIPTPEILLEAQLQSAKEFAKTTDILALEYQGNALSAVTLTAELDTPWIYNAREVDYEEFKQNLRICVESGAQGFMAGDPFWVGENTTEVLSKLNQGPEQVEYIKTEVRDKVIEAVRIAGE
jgi:tagatose-1,6-bisphosphate aldolase